MGSFIGQLNILEKLTGPNINKQDLSNNYKTRNKRNEKRVPNTAENLTKNDKQVWEYKMSDYLKSKCVLKGNLHNLYTVLMAMCNTQMRNQVKALPEYKDIDKKLDSMRQLKR